MAYPSDLKPLYPILHLPKLILIFFKPLSFEIDLAKIFIDLECILVLSKLRFNSCNSF